MEVRRGSTTDTYGRRDDEPPFFGGGGIADGSFVCSAGYPVQNSADTRFMVTAGHCFLHHIHRGGSLHRAPGLRSASGFDHPRRKGHGTRRPPVQLWRRFTGGVDSPTAIPIVNYGNAQVGYSNYCFSGRTSGEQCGKTMTSTNATACSPTGCKTGLIAFVNGQMPQGGDSGCPFYASSLGAAFIRGHITTTSPTTGYAEPYSLVAATYGVTGAIQ